MSEWKPIVGYETRYEVSNDGMVRKIGGKLLKQWLSDQGYSLVRLSGPRSVARVHRLVAECFVKNEASLPFVNHKDFNRSNNAHENLEWCTQLQNIQHSDAAGRMQRSYWSGRRSPNASLSDDQVAAIRVEYALGETSYADLAFRYRLSKRTIGNIVRRKTYCAALTNSN